MKITIDLNKPFRDIADIGDKDSVDGLMDSKETLARILALALRSTSEGDALEYLEWVMVLVGKKPLELEKAAYERLLKFVEGSKIWALAKGQIIEVLKAAKELAEKAAKPAA